MRYLDLPVHVQALYYKLCLLNFLSGREFSQKANLMKHELVHTDVKPFKCMLFLFQEIHVTKNNVHALHSTTP